MFGGVGVSRWRDGVDHEAANVTEYRNQGTPRDALWGNGGGRTVETQAGGLAVLRAYWELSQLQ